MNWSPEQSAQLYHIHHWGNRFFQINARGNVEVCPQKEGVSIDLKELVDDLQRRQLQLPILVRFSDILKSRIQKLNECFEKASKHFEFYGNYMGVYPIKVNPQRQVIEEIVRFGKPYHFGLEAGSKPELHAVLAMMDNPEALIVCNGYKDEAYIRLALLAQKLQHQVFLVVEKPSEMALILKVAKQLQIQPLIGIRIKLSNKGSGAWANSGGEFSKFGLTAAEIMDALQLAKREGYADCIQLLHFHLGSQITHIQSLKTSMKEVCRYFSELSHLGFPIKYLDVGGGLGVDYDGSRSTSASSANYSIQEYANDIVCHLVEICTAEDLPHPHIISESGRALTAHHSVLICDVKEASVPVLWRAEDQVHSDDDKVIQDLYSILQNFTQTTLLEHWHDAQELKEQSLQKFNLGILSLHERSKAERLYWSVLKQIFQATKALPEIPEELMCLRKYLAHKFFCNFSVFQSLPDSWAIDQAFPIMPLQRLEECPTEYATLHDITCDSDGKVECFVRDRQLSDVLPVHKQNEDSYYIGVFLVGAYQEILGDLHNLFGDTNAVHVALNDNGSWHYEQIIEGENVSDVLDYVQFSSDDLLERISQKIGFSLDQGMIQQQEANEFIQMYRQGLQGYTYLIQDPKNPT